MDKTQNTVKRVNRVLEIARAMAEKEDKARGGCWVRNHIEEIQLHSEYAEPGYSGTMIATGNWNTITKWDKETSKNVLVSDLPSRVGDLLEKMGVECEWSDEWSTCNDCGRLVRTSADSYSWQPSFAIVNECELVCHECLEDCAEDYLKGLENDPNQANAVESVDPTDHGYIKVNKESYESGWHPGQTDSPAKIAKELKEKGVERFLFNVDSVGQFDARWSVYVHQDDIGLIQDPPDGNEYTEPSDDE